MLNSCFMYQITDEPQENCLQHKNKDISSSLRKSAKQVAAHEPMELLLSLIIMEGMEALENVTAMGSAVCVLCQDSSSCSKESLPWQRQSRSLHSWDTAGLHWTGTANWGRKALKFLCLGEKCVIFSFLKTQKCHVFPDLFLSPEAEPQR